MLSEYARMLNRRESERWGHAFVQANLARGESRAEIVSGRMFLDELPRVNSQDVVLDLGCGMGTLTIGLMVDRPQKLYGVDPSEPMISVMRERFIQTQGVDIFQAPAEEVSVVIPAGSITRAFAHCSFEYFDNPLLAFQELGKVLTPAGDFSFGVYHSEEGLTFQDLLAAAGMSGVRHGREFSRQELRDIAGKGGFTLECRATRPAIFNDQLFGELVTYRAVRGKL